MAEAATNTTTEEVSTVQELWSEYTLHRDQELRNELVVHYSGLVKAIALRMRGAYKSYAQLDDVVNQGIITLIDAVEKFDPDKGFKFETFASIKIKGAIIDYVRAQDWVPRRLRKLSSDLENAYNRLHSELGRAPTNPELANDLQISIDQLDRAMEQTHSFNLLSYEDVVWRKMAAMGEEPQTDNIEDSPEQKLMETELRMQLGNAIDALNERERTVISLYYYEQLKLKEIAEILGVSESRVSQIHSAALLKMKHTMKEYIEN